MTTLCVVGVGIVVRSLLTPASYGTPSPPPTLPPATTFPVITAVVTPKVCPPAQPGEAERTAAECAGFFPAADTSPPGPDDGGR